jgi:hypothetical protein
VHGRSAWSGARSRVQIATKGGTTVAGTVAGATYLVQIATGRDGGGEPHMVQIATEGGTVAVSRTSARGRSVRGDRRAARRECQMAASVADGGVAPADPSCLPHPWLYVSPSL